ncbi:iron(III) transport system ATP-binding protein [Comamonas sp. BIGb0124]|uniref:ABC transporter ATP-binding protein n=1 Tax=Comamonas sp. BIGb0124 TaxID=2485130 RepID=UPI000F480397|nr:ATP-binding cassette domain-containing protein [Comamonas sp. BIGb0124]ROR21579.1 iron(III) transport system ATP-binding protein [Comamonas sp. BIGb0124]
MSLRIQNLNKAFNGQPALRHIDLTVGPADFVCLLGPSGCGKTTLLRIVAGLLDADSGHITLDGRDLAAIPARARGFGLVFQSYSLFTHMTVAENIGYGLRIRKTPADQVQRRIAELLQVVRLPGFAERYPDQLSGGQQQRVAIARALAVDPALLLLDEPLSALDARVRAELRHELREVQQRLRIPTLMVTHDQEEAMSMADTIVCMNDGRIEQAGSPRALYLQPQTRFVADFMGHSNLLDAEAARLLLPSQAPAPQAQPGLALCVRPEQLRLEPARDAAGRVLAVSFLGSIQRIRIEWRGRTLLAQTTGGLALHAGDRVHVQLDDTAAPAWVPAPSTGVPDRAGAGA